MYFPINVNLTDRPCLIVGGGRIALRKARQLATCGAQVTVIAPEIVDELAALADHVHPRRYVAGDATGFRLVITATGDREVDQLVFDDADERGIWVNSADDPDRCSFILPAVLRRGPVMVTTSTSGTSPALASWLRARLAAIVGPQFEAVAADLAAERATVHAAGVSTEDIDWEPILERILAQHNVGPCLATTAAPLCATGEVAAL